MNDKQKEEYIKAMTKISALEQYLFILIRNTVINNSIQRSIKSIKKQTENFFST